MKASDLREKTTEELQSQLQDLYKDQFNYRMQRGGGQLAQIHLIKDVKKDIARIKTIMSEKANQQTDTSKSTEIDNSES